MNVLYTVKYGDLLVAYLVALVFNYINYDELDNITDSTRRI